jgi:hypothetical protein
MQGAQQIGLAALEKSVTFRALLGVHLGAFD